MNANWAPASVTGGEMILQFLHAHVGAPRPREVRRR